MPLKNTNNKYKTVGEASLDLRKKDVGSTPTPTEQMRENLTEYEQNVFECAERNKSTFNDDFYVVVLTKKEKLMPNVLRHYYLGRRSCPKPNYDQIVYKYTFKDDKLELLWVIPDRLTCIEFKKYSASIDPSQWELLSNILKFSDGSLFKLAKELNGEKTE